MGKSVFYDNGGGLIVRKTIVRHRDLRVLYILYVRTLVAPYRHRQFTTLVQSAHLLSTTLKSLVAQCIADVVPCLSTGLSRHFGDKFSLLNCRWRRRDAGNIRLSAKESSAYSGTAQSSGHSLRRSPRHPRPAYCARDAAQLQCRRCCPPSPFPDGCSSIRWW